MPRKINRVIYRLWHPCSAKGIVGYIGKDSYYPSRSDLDARSRDKKCRKLWAALAKYGFEVWQKDILQTGFTSDEDLNEAEKFYIQKFNSKNKGYNCTDGGEGVLGIEFSPETRAKMSRSALGKVLSAETKRRISLAVKGVKRSPEVCEKISQGKLGKKRPDMSIRMKGNSYWLGRKVSPETKDKLSRLAKGRVISPETRAKISAALKGRKLAPETVAKIRQAGLGKKFSDETRAKLSAALIGNKNGTGNKSWLGRKFSPQHLENLKKSRKNT